MGDFLVSLKAVAVAGLLDGLVPPLEPTAASQERTGWSSPAAATTSSSKSLSFYFILFYFNFWLE